MAVRVILPTSRKSRKTTKFDAPVGLLGRVSRTGSNYDSSRKPNGHARHFANFRKIEKNDKVRSVYGGSVGETRISV